MYVLDRIYTVFYLYSARIQIQILSACGACDSVDIRYSCALLFPYHEDLPQLRTEEPAVQKKMLMLRRGELETALKIG